MIPFLESIHKKGTYYIYTTNSSSFMPIFIFWVIVRTWAIIENLSLINEPIFTIAEQLLKLITVKRESKWATRVGCKRIAKLYTIRRFEKSRLAWLLTNRSGQQWHCRRLQFYRTWCEKGNCGNWRCFWLCGLYVKLTSIDADVMKGQGTSNRPAGESAVFLSHHKFIIKSCNIIDIINCL